MLGGPAFPWHRHGAQPPCAVLRCAVQCTWNPNGNWLLSCGRDALCLVFDIRTQQAVGQYKGHAKEVCSAAWHPWHEDMWVSGGHDGDMLFWLLGQDTPQAEVRGGAGGG